MIVFSDMAIKLPQNRKGHFLNTFLQLAAEKKDSKNSAAREIFGPSYFELTLGKNP